MECSYFQTCQSPTLKSLHCRAAALLPGLSRRRLKPLQFNRISRDVAHSSAIFRYLRTLSLPTTYGFELPDARFASSGRLILDLYQSVWLERMISAPAGRTMSLNRCADRM